MAKRTPLGTSANFAVNPFNPTETEFQAYWGVYAWDTTGVLPTVGGRSAAIGTQQLPNAPNNLLAAPEWAKLRVGDIAGTAENAGVAGGTATADGTQEGLFSCIYPGTAGGGDAVWVRLDNETGAIQTVRDAHVIVVGQDNSGYANMANVFAATPPPADQLNLSAAGEQISVTVDFLDSGNGTELEKALLVATAAAAQIDVRLRPCSIALVPAELTALPLVVPSQCRLIGASRWESFIASSVAVNDSQEVLKIQQNAELIDVAVTSGVSAGTPGAGASKAMIITEANARIERCLITMDGVARSQPWAIWDSTGTVEVLDCKFFGANQTDAASPSIAIALGADPATSPDTFTNVDSQFAYRVKGCQTLAGGNGGFNSAVFVYNVGGGGHVSECDFQDIARPQLGAVGFKYGGSPVAAVQSLCPTVNDVRISIAATEDETDNPYIGVLLNNEGDLQAGFNLADFEWTAIRVYCKGPAAAVDRYGYVVSVDTASALNSNKIEGGVISGVITLGSFSVGLALRSSNSGAGSLASISNIRVASSIFKSPSAIVATPVGALLQTDASAACKITNVGFSNNDCTNAPATGIGLFINQPAFGGSLIQNTIVLGNHLVPNGGTALTDTGTTTEAAHNILV